MVTAQSWDYSPVLWWSSMEWFRFTRLNADCANRSKLSCVVLLNTWPGNKGLHFTQRLTTLTEWGKKEEHSKANPKECPLWEAMFTHRSVTLWSRESLSIWLSLWRESDSCTWQSSSSVIISKAASSGGLEASLATVPEKKNMRRNINTISWLSGKQTSKTLKGEAWAVPLNLQMH